MRQIKRLRAGLLSMFPLFKVCHEADYKTPIRPGVNVSYALSLVLGRLQDTNKAWCQWPQITVDLLFMIIVYKASVS